jgi:ATPase subunit of ABC transporter with duplicated ATPase domains
MRGTLAARSVSKSYGAAVVLDGVSLTISPSRRIGLIGPNGVGKSTLLRILAGEEQPDSGAVARMPPSLTVGYLPQEPDARPDETLLGYLARRTGVAEAGRALDELAARLEHDPSVAGAYGEALELYLALGGDGFEARAGAVCAELGLRANRLGLPVEHLSGGEAARSALAGILLARFDILLLDEPTNNLDFAGLDRLEEFMAGLPGGAAIVSHDRAFLDRTVDRIVELADEYGERRVREYAGGWTEYEQVRARERERQAVAYADFSEERDRVREQARRMQQWEERGYGQGRKKKKTKDVKKAFEKKLARLEPVEKPWQPWRLRLELAPARRGGDVVAALEAAVVERGSFLLGPIDLLVRQGDRVAVLGSNGSGKTTLLKALVGELPLASGRRRIGPSVVFGDLPQAGGPFDHREQLLSAFTSASGLPEGDARTALAKFDLGPDDVLRVGSSLSPGERNRAALALVSARGVNTLALDEPTNHLDLGAIEELEAVLEGYEGTVLLVTHDRRFLERFHPTQTIAL